MESEINLLTVYVKDHVSKTAHLSVHPVRFDMREMVFTNGVEQQHQPATFIPNASATPVVQSSHTIHQGGIKWGIRGSGILDSEGSHR